MKSFLIFFISLFLLGCVSEKMKINFESCPQVFFSMDHKIYITTDQDLITYDNITYIAELNNYSFDTKCQVSNNILSTTLSLLFVVKPEKAKQANIILPYFIAVVDAQQNIIDLQYYNTSGVLKKNIDTSIYLETELVDKKQINIPYKNINTDIKNKILIGFMLDDQKKKILN